MFKSIAALSAVLIALPVFAFQSESIKHIIQKDRIVKRGVVNLTTKEFKDETFSLEIKYRITASVLFMTKTFDGTTKVELPIKFLEPYGYEDLEEVGRTRDANATIIHLGRVRVPNFYDCHRVKIIPTDRSKNWDGIFTYCPGVESIGFARTQINMRNIPYVGSHTVYSRISK